MMRKLSILFVLLVLVFSFINVNIYALPLTFFGEDANISGGVPALAFLNSMAAQNDFLSYLNPDRVYVEDFERFAARSSGLTIDFGEAGTATLNGGYVSGLWDVGAVGAGRFSTSFSGDQFLEVQTSMEIGGGIGTFTLEFEKAQSAFGFFGTDFENSQVILTFENLLGDTLMVEIPHDKGIASGSVLFFGVVDIENPFTKVTFSGNNFSRDWFGFDDFTIATKKQVAINTPEPGTLLMLAVGLLGIFARIHRKNR